MKRVIFSLALASVGMSAHAGVYYFSAFLDGGQESPPVNTPATGSGALVFDDVAGTLSGHLVAFNLTSAVSNYHIHVGAIGVSGPVRVNLMQPGNIVNSNGAIWTSQFNLDLNQAGVLNGTTVAGLSQILLGGTGYFNVHTTNFPGGEIRGQIVQAVPEPGTLAALGLGMAVLLRRRARK